MRAPSPPQKQNPTGGSGFGNGKTQFSQANRITVSGIEQNGRRLPPFGAEVAAALLAGKAINLCVFGGAQAWKLAERRLITHGPGSRLVLPDGIDPASLRWPVRGQHVLVQWPGRDAFGRKVDLGRALIRDGAESAHIQHEPRWLRVVVKAVAR